MPGAQEKAQPCIQQARSGAQAETGADTCLGAEASAIVTCKNSCSGLLQASRVAGPVLTEHPGLGTRERHRGRKDMALNSRSSPFHRKRSRCKKYKLNVMKQMFTGSLGDPGWRLEGRSQKGLCAVPRKTHLPPVGHKQGGVRDPV